MARARTLDPVVEHRSAGGMNLHVFTREPSAEGISALERALKESASQQIDDPFVSDYASTGFGADSTVKPPYNPNALLKLALESNILGQCIQAMVINCEAFGHRFEYIGPEDQMDSAAAQRELEWLSQFLDSPNGGEYDFIEMRKRIRADRETLGYGYIECSRDARNDVDMMWHVPAHTVRMTSRDRKGVKVKVSVMRRGVQQTVPITRRFRRFVQQIGTRKVYFKEFGDPRTIDPKTGKVEPSLSLEEAATELLHIPLYSPGQAYGVPRWVNQLPAIMGSRESELTNLEFFKDNAIPAMAVLVSGGGLTQASINSIEEHINSMRGRKSINRIIVMEAVGDEAAASEQGAIPLPRIDMKPLARERQADELFQVYDKNNQDKVRSSFRLPPIFIGRSDDYTRATARESLVVAENQVFGPERNAVDELFNTQILTIDGKRPEFWQLRTNPPRMVGSDQVSDSLTTLNALGAMTPNIAIGLANEMFDLSVPMIEADWGNVPFEVVRVLLARGAVLEGMEDLYAAIPEELETGNDDDVQRNDGTVVIRSLRQLRGWKRGAARARSLAV